MPSILAFGKYYYIYLFLFNMGEEGKGRDGEGRAHMEAEMSTLDMFSSPLSLLS